MNKQQRKALYEYLSSTGYVFSKERHKKLKHLLTAPPDQTEKVEEVPTPESPLKTLEHYDDNDPNLLNDDEEN